MRKFCSILICAIVCLLVWSGVKWHQNRAVPAMAAGDGVQEFYDREENIRAARKIGGFEGVTDAAVLNRNGKILAGVMAEEGNEEQLYQWVTASVAESFPNAEQIAVSINSAAAIDVLELSYYLGGGINGRAAEQRFEQLFRRAAGAE